jgi:hypothetical protein
MALPRRLIAIAVSAAAAGAFFYISSKLRQPPRDRGPLDDANDAKDSSKRTDGNSAGQRAGDTSKHDDSQKNAGSRGASDEASTASQQASSSSAGGSTTEAGASSAQRELSLFLAGDTWYDEIGWQALWEKEGVGAPDEWLRTRGRDVLLGERKKLVEHPALLAGCRRRWIVVCRYAGIDVGDAAHLWNQSENA